MTPSPEQFAAVAGWLAECTVCGEEHEYRQTSSGRWTWESTQGNRHSYRKRLTSPSTYVSGDVIALLRAQVDLANKTGAAE